MTTTPHDFTAARHAMVVSQLRPAGVASPRLLDAMLKVPRETYLPASLHAAAYIDRALVLGDGVALNPPVTTALLLDAARVGGNDHVLIIGAATGYVAAVVEATGASVTVQVIDDIGETIAGGPFDVILIDGAVEQVPDALVAALKPDGRLVTGLVEDGVTRLALGRRGGSGFGLLAFADGEAVVFDAFAKPRAFTF